MCFYCLYSSVTVFYFFSQQFQCMYSILKVYSWPWKQQMIWDDNPDNTSQTSGYKLIHAVVIYACRNIKIPYGMRHQGLSESNQWMWQDAVAKNPLIQLIPRIEFWHCRLLPVSRLPRHLYDKVFKQEMAPLTSCAWRVSCNLEGAPTVVRSYISETGRSGEGERLGDSETTLPNIPGSCTGSRAD